MKRRIRADRVEGTVRRLEAQARRNLMLVAYLRGEKVEYIAAVHNVTPRMVHLYVQRAGIARAPGRPRKPA